MNLRAILFSFVFGCCSLVFADVTPENKSLNLSPYPPGYLAKPANNPGTASVQETGAPNQPNPMLNDTHKIKLRTKRKKAPIGVQGAAGTQGSNAAVKGAIGTFK